MTREEAIRWLKNIKNVGYIKNLLNHSGAIDMAIKALEQGDISGKIRAEIEKQEKWLVIAGYNSYNVDIALDAIKSALVVDQEPCEDAISRQAVIDTIERWLSCDDYNEAERYIMKAVRNILYEFPSVNPQPKMGHWRAIYQGEEIIDYRCSECEFGNTFGQSTYRMNFCPNCGAKMVEPQETETWNGIHGQIIAPKGTFERIFNDVDDDSDV